MLLFKTASFQDGKTWCITIFKNTHNSHKTAASISNLLSCRPKSADINTRVKFYLLSELDHCYGNLAKVTQTHRLWCDKVPPPVISEYCRKQRHNKSWIFNATPGNGCYFLWCSEASTSTALDWQFPAVQGLFIKLDARDHFSERLERLDPMLQRHRVANGRLWQKGATQTFLWHSDYPRTKALCQIWLCLPKHL